MEINMYIDDSMIKIAGVIITFLVGLFSGAYGKIREREKTNAFQSLLETRLSDNTLRLDAISQEVYRSLAKGAEVYEKFSQINTALEEVRMSGQKSADRTDGSLRRIEGKVIAVIEIVHDMNIQLSKIKGAEADRELQKRIEHIRDRSRES